MVAEWHILAVDRRGEEGAKFCPAVPIEIKNRIEA